MSEYNLKTGDILLCDYEGNNTFYYYFSRLIRIFTGSNFTHVCMILKDPIYIHPSLRILYGNHSGQVNLIHKIQNQIRFN